MCLARERYGLTLKELAQMAGELQLSTIGEAVSRFQRRLRRKEDLAVRFTQAGSALWSPEPRPPIHAI